MPRILIIEDDEKLREELKIFLNKNGYEATALTTFDNTINDILKINPDLILLDINLPNTDGEYICKEIRKKSNMPIIIVTSRDNEIDELLSINNGADHYITKPFSVRELMARVKANLRKSETHYDSLKSSHDSDSHKETKKLNTIKIGDLTLDLEKYEVNVNGTIVNLTLREFEVLKYLAQQQGQVVTRESLLEQVWGYEYYGDIRTVDVTVRRIREKIEKDTSSPKILITKRGVGYYIASK